MLWGEGVGGRVRVERHAPRRAVREVFEVGRWLGDCGDVEIDCKAGMEITQGARAASALSGAEEDLQSSIVRGTMSEATSGLTTFASARPSATRPGRRIVQRRGKRMVAEGLHKRRWAVRLCGDGG